MDLLNYHHLRYFREVAKEGHLGRAAARLNVSQSALSMQIKALEDRLGHQFFDRVGRRLILTEAGRIALDHADRIFGAGEELLATLRQGGTDIPPLRIGSLSTLSRNFQLQFLRPLLGSDDCSITLKSGNTHTLMADLEASLRATAQATSKAPFGTVSAQRAARLKQKLLEINQRTSDPHVQQAFDAALLAPLKLNQSDLLHIFFPKGTKRENLVESVDKLGAKRPFDQSINYR